MICMVLMDVCSLLTGVLSSVIGAITVLFILFFIFRPRIKVHKEIVVDEDRKLMFCFSNKSIAPCINVQVALKVVTEHDNADETESKIDLEDSTSPYMSGRWSKKKDSEVAVVTQKTKEELPSHLRIIISAQHAVSGIVSVTTQDFFAESAKDGTFEKGLYIPKGSDYARVCSREHLKSKKIASWICAACISIITLAYGLFFAETWQAIIVCFILLSCFSTLIIIFWSIHVQSRINAFSSRSIFHKINLMMVAIGKEFPKIKRDIEDIEPTEGQEKHRRERVRKH